MKSAWPWYFTVGLPLCQKPRTFLVTSAPVNLVTARNVIRSPIFISITRNSFQVERILSHNLRPRTTSKAVPVLTISHKIFFKKNFTGNKLTQENLASFLYHLEKWCRDTCGTDRPLFRTGKLPDFEGVPVYRLYRHFFDSKKIFFIFWEMNHTRGARTVNRGFLPFYFSS